LLLSDATQQVGYVHNGTAVPIAAATTGWQAIVVVLDAVSGTGTMWRRTASGLHLLGSGAYTADTLGGTVVIGANPSAGELAPMDISEIVYAPVTASSQDVAYLSQYLAWQAALHGYPLA
jgi:hypothetical protein